MRLFFLVIWLLLGVPGWGQEAAPSASAAPSPSPSGTLVPAPSVADPKAEAQSALLQGRELQRKGFTDSAIVNYRRAIELDPELVPAYEELGQILLDTRNQGFAITIYQKLAALQPNEVKWKDILFNLHTAYEKPQEAAEVGEQILLVRPNDTELMGVLAQQYEASGRMEEYANTLARRATLTKEPAVFYKAGDAYMGVGRTPEAIDAYRQAVQLMPGSIEYQEGLGRGLAVQDPYSARDHYETLLKEHPDAAGIKGRLAETEVAIGDRLFERRRYVAARESYERAQALLPTPDPAIAERIAKAERLNHVYFENFDTVGQQGTNNFFWMNNVVGVPLQSTDLTFQAILDNRWASATGQPLPTQSLTSVLAGLDYKLDEYTNIYAQGGTNSIFRVGGFYQDDWTTAGLRFRRDIVSYTPLALNERLHWNGVDMLLNRQITDWFGMGGDLAFNNYEDGIPETVYNISPFFTPIFLPQQFVWSILYNHGGVFNSREANPLLRFGPTNFQVDSFGTQIEHWLSKDFRYNLGYFYSTSNQGINGNTFVGGLDAQLGEGSYLWLNMEYGNFLGGRIAPGVFSNTANNYLLQGGFRVTF